MRSTCTAIRAGVVLLGFGVAAAFGNSVGVTNANDSGPGSLRAAIASAAPGDTIYFNPKTMRYPAAITLTSTLFINKNLSRKILYLHYQYLLQDFSKIFK